jgi:hypothetical protein
MIHQGRSNPCINSAMFEGSSGSQPPYQRLKASGGRWLADAGCGVGGESGMDGTNDEATGATGQVEIVPFR